MSGGVDSLRAAALLKQEGHDVFAVHMRLMPASPPQRTGGGGPADKDADAMLNDLASRLEIPLHIADLEEEFDRTVVSPFLKTYQQGLTPNPCFLCNAKIKFGLLRDVARKNGAEGLATGHYARTLPPGGSNGRYRLLRGADTSKDQSYFLALLSQEQLAFSIFPLGGETKQSVRNWARQAGFGSLIRKESQEICFIPAGSYREFLQSRLGEAACRTSGPIKDLNGNLLGEHHGLFAYTIGQRRGLGIPSHAPYYVVKLDARTNTLFVGRDEDLFQSQLTAAHINWLSIEPPDRPLQADVRIRYRHTASPAVIHPLPDQKALVCFESPQRAVTPGQAVVFYAGDTVLGGGFITPESGPPCPHSRPCP